MYRAAIAVLLAAAAFSPTLEAQMRPMSRPAGPARIGSGPHFGVVQPRGGLRPIGTHPFGARPAWINPAIHRHPRSHVFVGNSCFNPFFCRQFFFPNRFLFRQLVFLPYPVYSAPFYSAPYYPVAEQAPQAAADRQDDLARQVERLTNEVERLREEQTSRAQARQTATPAPPVKENEATILVFRDGRTSEVRNYATVGQTLWALTEQRARKIPISDLDVDATRKVNADRGVEIRLP